MIPGLSGSLLSHEALERQVPGVLSGHLGESERRAAQTRIRAWHVPLRAQLGPATSARACFDRLAAPLFAQLGYRVVPAAPFDDRTFRALLLAAGNSAATLVVTGWGQDAGPAWRNAVRLGIAAGVSWCFCLTGPAIRIVDTRRTYSRRFAEFSLDRTIDDDRAFGIFWGLLRSEAMQTGSVRSRSLLEHAIELSEAHRALLRASLQQGVHGALEHLVGAFVRTPRRRVTSAEAFDASLIVVYRVLFLLFAEARGMVPQWHPIFRDGYTVEALREPIQLLPRPRGLWETLQAIARLAHRGCQIGSLRVTAFNGRLFSPAHSPLADTTPLDDREVREAVLALTTRPVPHGRTAIAYGDLGVEQLGGIYERLLDFESAATTKRSRPSLVRSGKRKATGAFYTPRSVTDYLVRRTLCPLVREATPEQILELRILDPAMGSGAFLVSACRYLAAAYESALLREGGLTSEDITDADRAGFRRTVAQRCLFGVDINPMAVQVGRLSLWLATLAADRPLTFLDHRLRTGNSLIGASLEDLARQPPSKRSQQRPNVPLPLFGNEPVDRVLCEAVGIRRRIANDPDDTLEQVRLKEQALNALTTASSLTQLIEVADLWCSPWFATNSAGDVLATAFGALADGILHGADTLPRNQASALRAEARRIAASSQFFHWTLEFPEVFFDNTGQPLTMAGFDAIIGNPPWEMLRGDNGDAKARADARSSGTQLTAFARGSGAYRLQGDGHANLYQLFLERALTLLRRNGRLGFVLPSGFAIDRGSAPLRQAMFDDLSVDALVSVENRDGVFPIHRGLKFLLLSASKTGPTTRLPCRFGIRSQVALDALPDSGTDSQSVLLPRAVVERFDGTSLVIPELRTEVDLQIVSQIAFEIPALGDSPGWNVHFGRELNATEDRQHFVRRTVKNDDIPVLEGKHLSPFVTDIGAAEYAITRRTAGRLVPRDRTFGRHRLAYRDVASSTNRLSLIAAIVPSDTVTTHTVFCLKEDLTLSQQHYLCGVFNSFVANYLVRLRINTHVSAAVIDRLPIPKPHSDDWRVRDIAHLAEKLTLEHEPASFGRLQANVASLYGLTREQFAHVLETFPLVDRDDREAALTAFCDIFDVRPRSG
jgi:Eco57I restriction-modification methylase